MNRSFFEELEKISQANEISERKQNALDATRATLAMIAGAAGGILSEKGFSKTKRLGPFTKALLSGLTAGGSAIMTNKAIKDYLNDGKKRRNRGKGSSNPHLLSSKQQHSERHKGHSSEVSSPLFRPDATGGVPFHTGQGPIFRRNERDTDGDNNNGQRDDRYRYNGKKTRHYRFTSPV